MASINFKDFKKPPPTILTIFGGTGDLTNRKLVPALYNLLSDDYLPDNFKVIGASRTKLSDQEFADRLYESVKKYSRSGLDEEKWQRFAKNIYYQPLNGQNFDDFLLLKDRFASIENENNTSFNKIYYLATSPNNFADIVSNLNGASLVQKDPKSDEKTFLIVEKPFGEDIASAKLLNKELCDNFSEDQIFRIDHYLGKETVQNILVFRFANGMFEPLWNRKYIDRIEISVCESIGVEGRASYFDEAGILRDIVQNHLLQMLSLLCIEAPISLGDANSIRNEKVKVLRAMNRFSIDEIPQRCIRGQYDKGEVNGEKVSSYLEDVSSAASDTETFVALRLGIDNWRWAGVPIYIRAGKRLPKRVTEITVFFQKTPQALFKDLDNVDIVQNQLRIQVQPNEGIALRISSKPPGPQMKILPVDMDFTYGGSFDVASADAYERLLLDAMKGDATLFTRNDEIEEAWDLLEPILNYWSDNPEEPLYKYEAGTWGPKEVDNLLNKQKNHKWRNL